MSGRHSRKDGYYKGKKGKPEKDKRLKAPQPVNLRTEPKKSINRDWTRKTPESGPTKRSSGGPAWGGKKKQENIDTKVASGHSTDNKDFPALKEAIATNDYKKASVEEVLSPPKMMPDNSSSKFEEIDWNNPVEIDYSKSLPFGALDDAMPIEEEPPIKVDANAYAPRNERRDVNRQRYQNQNRSTPNRFAPPSSASNNNSQQHHNQQQDNDQQRAYRGSRNNNNNNNRNYDTSRNNNNYNNSNNNNINNRNQQQDRRNNERRNENNYQHQGQNQRYNNNYNSPPQHHSGNNYQQQRNEPPPPVRPEEPQNSYSDQLFDEIEKESPTSLSQDIRSNVPKKTIPPSDGGHNQNPKRSRRGPGDQRNQRKRGYNEINIRATKPNSQWQNDLRFQMKDNPLFPYSKRSEKFQSDEKVLLDKSQKDKREREIKREQIKGEHRSERKKKEKKWTDRCDKSRIQNQRELERLERGQSWRKPATLRKVDNMIPAEKHSKSNSFGNIEDDQQTISTVHNINEKNQMKNSLNRKDNKITAKSLPTIKPISAHSLPIRDSGPPKGWNAADTAKIMNNFQSVKPEISTKTDLVDIMDLPHHNDPSGGGTQVSQILNEHIDQSEHEISLSQIKHDQEYFDSRGGTLSTQRFVPSQQAWSSKDQNPESNNNTTTSTQIMFPSRPQPPHQPPPPRQQPPMMHQQQRPPMLNTHNPSNQPTHNPAARQLVFPPGRLMRPLSFGIPNRANQTIPGSNPNQPANMQPSVVRNSLVGVNVVPGVPNQPQQTIQYRMPPVNKGKLIDPRSGAVMMPTYPHQPSFGMPTGRQIVIPQPAPNQNHPNQNPHVQQNFNQNHPQTNPQLQQQLQLQQQQNQQQLQIQQMRSGMVQQPMVMFRQQHHPSLQNTSNKVQPVHQINASQLPPHQVSSQTFQQVPGQLMMRPLPHMQPQIQPQMRHQMSNHSQISNHSQLSNPSLVNPQLNHIPPPGHRSHFHPQMPPGNPIPNVVPATALNPSAAPFVPGGGEAAI